MTTQSTVQTLTCHRDGVQLWAKQVYIKGDETGACYDLYNNKKHGVFVYTLTGMQVVQRKPRNVVSWMD
jgi:hypothetical protein